MARRSTPSSRASLRTGGFASTLGWAPGAPLARPGDSPESATEPFPAGALRGRQQGHPGGLVRLGRHLPQQCRLVRAESLPQGHDPVGEVRGRSADERPQSPGPGQRGDGPPLADQHPGGQAAGDAVQPRFDRARLGLPGLARALASLADTARAGQATPADLTGGTITITNVGVFGIDAGTPIITPPEAAILAFGQIRDAPWVVDGQLAVRKVTTLSLSFDHRIVDGDLGSAVLRDIGAMLHDPTVMLAWG